MTQQGKPKSVGCKPYLFEVGKFTAKQKTAVRAVIVARDAGKFG